MEIPESDEYDTLAGFITYNHGNIPKVNDVIIIDRYEIKILKLSHARIELVKLKLNS